MEATIGCECNVIICNQLIMTLCSRRSIRTHFAESESETNGKAHNHGAMFTCSVLLGNSRVIGPQGDSTVTFGNLLQSGYDSVTIQRPGGTEYVVYNSDQVRILNLDLLD